MRRNSDTRKMTNPEKYSRFFAGRAGFGAGGARQPRRWRTAASGYRCGPCGRVDRCALFSVAVAL